MRFIATCCAALAVFALTLLAWNALRWGYLPDPDDLADHLISSAIMLLIGAVLVTGPVWLLARRRLSGPIGWTLAGLAAGVLSVVVAAFAGRYLPIGLGDLVIDLRHAARYPMATITIFASFAAAGALSHAAGWWAGRR